MKLIFMLLTLFCFKAFSQANIAEDGFIENQNKFSMNMFFMGATNMYRDGAFEKQYTATQWTFFNYQFTQDNTLFVWTKFNKDMTDPYQEAEFGDTDIVYTFNNLYRNKNLIVNSNFGLIAPTSENSQLATELQIGVRSQLTSVYRLTPTQSLIYLARHVYRAHRFEFDRDGNNLSQNQFLQFFIHNWTLSNNSRLQTLLIYSRSWDYFGAELTPSYFANIEYTYMLNRTHSLALALGNGNQIVDFEQAENQNIRFYDPETSTVTASWIVTL
jgi:hypothetical protein